MAHTEESLRAFNEIAKALTSTLELNEVLHLVMQRVSEVLAAPRWALLLHDARTGELYAERAFGMGADKSAEAKQVFVTGKAHRAGLLMVVPLRFRGSALGVIQLIREQREGPFTEEDEEAASGIADFAAIALNNARTFQTVQELTITDEHTALFNARHLMAQLDREVARAGRFIHRLSLLFIDLDEFKKVNDTHGHLVGSAVLREFGEVLRNCVRQVDLPFRYGGDEFAAVLVETDVAGALTTAERIVQRVREHLFGQDRGLAVRVTASVGVATFPDHASNSGELLQAADRAMYAVKSAGRNGVQTARILEETLRKPEETPRPTQKGVPPPTGWD
ncbi:MAG: sensor domain-containing diguanylate cyclase [Myxococcaceae bacterium]